MQKNIRGFTIVELLIVIVVIGILAAITIVAFNGIQARANVASISSDLTAFSKKVEIFKIDNSLAAYPATVGDLNSLDIKLNKNAYMTGTSSSINLLYCQSSSNANYALLAQTKDSKKIYVSNISSSPQEYTGADDWNGTDYQARCRTVLPGSFNTAQAGYSRGDTTTGPWRAWTGVTN